MTANRMSPENLKALCYQYEKITGWNPLLKTRKRTVTIPRQCLFYILRKKCKMNYAAIANLFQCNHATVIHGERVIHEQLQVKDSATLQSMSLWIDILQNIMPDNVQMMFSVQDRILSMLESTLLNTPSKIEVLREVLKKYEETTSV